MIATNINVHASAKLYYYIPHNVQFSVLPQSTTDNAAVDNHGCQHSFTTKCQA